LAEHLQHCQPLLRRLKEINNEDNATMKRDARYKGVVRVNTENLGKIRGRRRSKNNPRSTNRQFESKETSICAPWPSRALAVFLN